MSNSEYKVLMFVLNLIIAVLGIYLMYWIFIELDAPQPIWFVFILYVVLSFLTGVIKGLVEE